MPEQAIVTRIFPAKKITRSGVLFCDNAL